MTAPARQAAADQLLAGLNEPQRDAVLHGDGPLLILAGAGSGKTRVLTHRIAHLVRTGRAHPNEVLAITFTNKAAAEMRERVERLLGRATRGMWLMTFHSACVRMLRANAERLGYKRGFTIYDDDDSQRLVKRCLEELDLDPKRFAPRAVKRHMSDAKNRLVAPDEYAQAAGSFFEEAVADVYALYERRAQESNAMDFDDLLVRAVQLLELFADVREGYGRAFKHVLVDEYQDTNRAQYRWLQLLVEGRRNLAVVGDDDQSIYSFRSADIRNILDFERDFPDAHVVKLEQNYRSTQTILSAANAVIANNGERKDKSLWTELGDGEPIHVRELEDEFAEARFVVGEIERRVDEGGSRDETAVFYRTNAQSRVLEEVLVRYGIRYQVVGGRKFYERKEIRDALAYLAFLVNPADALAFARIAGAPKRGIGDTTVARIVGQANTLGEPVWDVARHPERIPGCGGAAVRAVGRFMETMEGLREKVEHETPVADLLDGLLHEVGYIEALQAERTVEAESRLDNLRELVEGARQFQASAEDASVAAFLEAVQLRSDQDELEDEAGSVTLMTLHSAKGLEFPVVFMVGMEDGVFPSSRAIEAGDLEEERRLCYVGMTRAMRELYVTFARTRRRFGGPPEWNAPSRFLAEVPPELTDVAHQEPSRRRAASWGGGAPAPAVPSARREPSPPSAQFAVGDDVLHAKFGEGVVVAREPGGIVVVRFPSEGEKKLMEDYAPLKRL